jgi:hypothetical protein
VLGEVATTLALGAGVSGGSTGRIAGLYMTFSLMGKLTLVGTSGLVGKLFGVWLIKASATWGNRSPVSISPARNCFIYNL